MRRALVGLFTWERFVPIVYWSATYALRTLLTVVIRWTVSGRAHVPARGGLIVVSNHLNNADPPILGAAVARRRIRYMAKIELFKYPFGAIPRLYGAFPVRRFDSDARALLTAERLLREGQVVGMFPEGTRSRTGRMGKLHPGTALVALRSGVPVLPCAITGTEILANPLRLALRPRFEVAIGEVLTFERTRRPTDEEIGEAMDAIFTAIKDLLPPQYHPPYTETDDNLRPPEPDPGNDPPGD